MWTDTASGKSENPAPNRAAPNDHRIASPADAQALIDGAARDDGGLSRKVLTVETEHLRRGAPSNDGLADNERKSARDECLSAGSGGAEGQRRPPSPFSAPAGGWRSSRPEHAAFRAGHRDEPDRAGHGRARSPKTLVKGISEELGPQPATPGLRSFGPATSPTGGATPLLVLPETSRPSPGPHDRRAVLP